MKLHEYQSKFLFREFGIPIPDGQVARTPDEAHEIASQLGEAVVVKAQVHVGGRGKAGGVKLARDADEARQFAADILGMDIKGLTVEQVLIDPAAAIQQEIYLAITNDRAAGCPLIMSSMEGGMDIEELNRERPEAIIRERIDPSLGLQNFQLTYIASAMGMPRARWRSFGSILRSLYRCYSESDAELAEINPLVITGGGELLAVDGKVIIDDNALFRQPKLAAQRDASGEPESERLAREAGITFIKLDGQIGCMVNGAGLAMTTMDMTKLYGDADGIGPANFLDIGGGASPEQVAAALRIILSDAKVRCVLINIFGGITRCDEVADGILTAYNEVKPNVPMVIRLQGTNASEGNAIISQARMPNIASAETLTQAAQMAVAAAKEQA
ncbi:MAG: ADP-forming succinate--CoA ligase subunit beta [Chloroflexi bacterium]|nr:ADP-forming succinate--CoA ligase subunit beta [Chloroflexota bacterium]MCY3583810.1 ADP-forming succinate--CoA ligase subunit beta [Chloroflexota bacterium]MCY3716258.1 ADP-forming succinate--CoA ligase subunit beta [Chloroflexota bacterium]MDE2650413.1 ADP-forming succinate--CoA ligase subunit beta [Chloroflexota bacterium]MXX82161.1 ADP-forming succinate--CoA ligase subunit beta [Chloroflexota bacterium]